MQGQGWENTLVIDALKYILVSPMAVEASDLFIENYSPSGKKGFVKKLMANVGVIQMHCQQNSIDVSSTMKSNL